MKKEELIKGMIKTTDLTFYTVEDFLKDAKAYLKAIEQKRMICSFIVSESGCRRHVKFLSCEKGKYSHYYRNYFAFFKAMGYKTSRKTGYQDYFIVDGCGMDMIFHTNNSIVNSLRYLGVIRKTKGLEQNTPTTI